MCVSMNDGFSSHFANRRENDRDKNRCPVIIGSSCCVLCFKCSTLIMPFNLPNLLGHCMVPRYPGGNGSSEVSAGLVKGMVSGWWGVLPAQAGRPGGFCCPGFTLHFP